ncbi:MAG: hypothetical protein ACFFBD_24360 [Candidatus Hodarchaeota archaeon]
MKKYVGLALGILFLVSFFVPIFVIANELDPGEGGVVSGYIDCKVKLKVKFESYFGTNYKKLQYMSKLSIMVMHLNIQSILSASIRDSKTSSSGWFISRDIYNQFKLRVYNKYPINPETKRVSSWSQSGTLSSCYSPARHDVFAKITTDLGFNSALDTDRISIVYMLYNYGTTDNDWTAKVKVYNWGSITDVDMDFFAPSWFS